MTESAENEVSDEAFAELAARVGELAEAMRQALTLDALSVAINQAIHPAVAALAMSERDLSNPTIH